MKKIDLVYFNAGGGHRSAATALQTVIREQGRPWNVRLVNLFEVLDPAQAFLKTTGFKPEDFYNKRLAHGWTVGLKQELKILQALIRLAHSTLMKRLQRHWKRTKPDMVVSLVPNFNRLMARALVGILPDVPYVVVLTDFADYPPHFWIEPNQTQHVICGTARAAFQARKLGSSKSAVHQTSGMIIPPDFYRQLPLDRGTELRRLGLDPHGFTAIVLFGGHGSSVMKRIASRLADTQLILICGHNAELVRQLRNMGSSAPRYVVGFTDEIRYFMAISDFFIGKPGPGCISEALHQRLPVIVVRNVWTMPQERYNTDWVLENGAGIVLNSFKQIRSAVAEMSHRIAEFRSNLERLGNNAIFEIPPIFENILRTDSPKQNLDRRIVPADLEAQ